MPHFMLAYVGLVSSSASSFTPVLPAHTQIWKKRVKELALSIRSSTIKQGGPVKFAPSKSNRRCFLIASKLSGLPASETN